MTFKINQYLIQVMLTLFGCVALIDSVLAADTSPAELQALYEKLAGRSADAAKGKKFFTTAYANDTTCATCHGNPPTQPSRHASTGKSIAALSPTVNADRFNDNAKVEKWFRRNCKDVLNRECTAPEKADVLAYLRIF